jgi:hypothetical protein
MLKVFHLLGLLETLSVAAEARKQISNKTVWRCLWFGHSKR